ncbi:TPA: hypothetical protein ACUUDZ_003041, partial [Pseudomonas aeruginosa]
MADPPRPVERAMRSQALRADVLML